MLQRAMMDSCMEKENVLSAWTFEVEGVEDYLKAQLLVGQLVEFR